MIFLPLFFATIPLEDFSRKVEAHLLVGDATNAVVVSKKCLEEYPKTAFAHEMLIKSLAKSGGEEEMIQAWEHFYDEFPEDAMKDKLLEELCWGVLRSGTSGDRLSTRVITLIGSALTLDVWAVGVLKNYMRDSSSIIRKIAVELASHYGDDDLKDEIIYHFRHEKVWEVREEILKAIAELKITSLLRELKALVRDSSVSSEEKREAIKTIALLHETPTRDELEVLVSSRWSQERALACKLIAGADLHKESDLLLKLLKDSQREVRREAYLAWGHLQLPAPDFVKEQSEGKDPTFGVLSGWILLLTENNESISGWLHHEREDVRLFAASAIAGGGIAGATLAEKVIEKVEDPFVAVNLALVMLKHRCSTEKAAHILYTFLKEQGGLLMFSEEPFSALRKSTKTHEPLLPNCPEVMNQVARIEMLNLLAIVEYPKAGEAIREFLKNGRWEVVGHAATALLGEGDESAIALVQKLLEDRDPQIRVESALLLAVWGKDKLALPVLLEAYPTADRSLKIKILEAFGRLCCRETIPFLIQNFKDPSQIFRIISASVLIQALNH